MEHKKVSIRWILTFFHTFFNAQYNDIRKAEGGGHIRRKQGNRNGFFIITFSVGVMLAFFLPLRWLVVLLSGALIVMGLILNKNCR